ncbi:MAG TPA: S24 family peptidase [Phycisphaerales bacterium]|nr:S24 family peptidase [Phycisphaerales bacterium]
MRSIGQVIRTRRKELGLTLRAVAEMAGCTKGYLCTIENDRRSIVPSKELIEKFERVLRLEAGALLTVGSWQSTPAEVRQQVLSMQTERHLTRRLIELLKREGIDKAHKSGELRQIVDRLAPDDDSTDHRRGGASGAGAHSSASGSSGAAGKKKPAGADRARKSHDDHHSTDGAHDSASIAPAPMVLPVQVPLINKVAAGYPREFTDLGYPARVADEYIAVPDVYDADAFAARVVGDSMFPDYHEGDIVVFSPTAPIGEGDDCFVRLERDEETTFKRVYFEKDPKGNELIRLQPLNSTYGPRTLPREDVAGLYAAVYVVRRVDKESKRKAKSDRRK